jgi:hypothetical protein
MRKTTSTTIRINLLCFQVETPKIVSPRSNLLPLLLKGILNKVPVINLLNF